MIKSRKGIATKLDRAESKLQNKKRNKRPDLDDDQFSPSMKQRRLNQQSRIDTAGVRRLQNEDSNSDEDTVVKKDMLTGKDKMKQKILIENKSSEIDANSDNDSGASGSGTGVKMSEKGFTGSGKSKEDNVESDDDSGNEDSDDDDDDDDSGGGNDDIDYETDDDIENDDSEDDDSDDDSSDNSDKDGNGDRFKLHTGSRNVKLKAKPLLEVKQSLESKQVDVVSKKINSKSLSSENESSDTDSNSEVEDSNDEDSADELKDNDKEIEVKDGSSVSQATFYRKFNTDHDNEKKQKPNVNKNNESSDSDDGSDASSEGADDEDGKINDLEEAETAEHDEEEDEFAAVKRELANIPLEDLMKIKEKLGLKMFNRIMHGDKFEDKGQKVFKRANKNRPMETSSKRRVPVLRHEVIAKEKIQRDPRFDDLSGEFEDKHFQQNYSFLDDVKSKEKLLVKKQLAKTKNEKKKKELAKLLGRMEQQEQAEQQKKRRLELEQQWKEREKHLVEKGKAPYFLKKSDRKKLELAEKFKELQKSGRVEKYMGKKLKKNARKEKKKLPNRHEKFM